MEEKQTRFVKYSDGEIKKPVTNAVPGVQKSQQNMLSRSFRR